MFVFVVHWKTRDWLYWEAIPASVLRIASLGEMVVHAAQMGENRLLVRLGERGVTPRDFIDNRVS